VRKIIISFSVLLFCSTISNGQIRPSVSNLFRYGNGEQILGNSKNNFEYFENLTDVRLGLPQNVNLGFRFLYDNPPEIGETFKGIKRKFVEYTQENLYVRVGNSSELYGRGLALNLFENRGLAYDTWIDGIKASYKLDNLKASIIAGTIDFRDSITVTRFENYELRGGNIEFKVIDPIKLGVSFISANSKIPQIDKTDLHSKTELPEFYLDFNLDQFSFFFNWANKWTTTPAVNKSLSGNGIYSSFSYADDAIGITFDYKNYKFDIQDPYLQNDETRTSKFLPFQNPPIVMKEQSYVFLSRPLHMVDFNDEVGFQIDINFAANEDLNFNLNYSLASRHNTYQFNNEFSFDKKNRRGNYLPSANKEFSPYQEVFLEGEYYFDFETAIRLGIAKRQKTIYNYFSGNSGNHTINSIVIPFQFQHTFSDNFSSIIQYEFENIDDNYNSDQPNFSNHFFSILNSLYRKITIAFRYEYTNNDFDISGRNDWLISELGYRLSGANLVTVSYGRERGGQVCTNGICRYLLPFKGLRFMFQTNF
jgi:hypothetical protein